MNRPKHPTRALFAVPILLGLAACGGAAAARDEVNPADTVAPIVTDATTSTMAAPSTAPAPTTTSIAAPPATTAPECEGIETRGEYESWEFCHDGHWTPLPQPRPTAPPVTEAEQPAMTLWVTLDDLGTRCDGVGGVNQGDRREILHGSELEASDGKLVVVPDPNEGDHIYLYCGDRGVWEFDLGF